MVEPLNFACMRSDVRVDHELPPASAVESELRTPILHTAYRFSERRVQDVFDVGNFIEALCWTVNPHRPLPAIFPLVLRGIIHLDLHVFAHGVCYLCCNAADMLCARTLDSQISPPTSTRSWMRAS